MTKMPADMAAEDRLKWSPKMSLAEAHGMLNQPGGPFEIAEVAIAGINTRVYKNAPPSLAAVFEAAKAHGKRDFIVYEDERLTFADHRQATLRLAHLFQTRYRLIKGDRVALAMRNYPEWIIAFWATAIIGAVIVPLNAWGTGRELEYGITDSGADILIVDAERLNRLKPHLRGLNLKETIAVRTEARDRGTSAAFEELLSDPNDYHTLGETVISPVEIDPEDNMTIFYTSGTTGKPKGALGSHRNIITNLMNTLLLNQRAALRETGKLVPVIENAPQRGTLLSVPLFHATGCHSIMLPSFAGGSKLVLMHRWNPEKALALIEQERLNGFGGVPAMVWQVLESPEFHKYDTSSITGISYGGAPSAPDLVRRIEELYPQVQPSNGYGLTETSAITTKNLGKDYLAKPESAGAPVPVCEIRIVDIEGEDVNQGEIGELWIKGPNVVKGYWNRPEATAETFTGGWLHSGDLVREDEEGFLYILDRAKDMLIRGGENIYCVEVEDALFDHSGVMDAAVIGIPHKILGEEVGAIVQTTPGVALSPADLKLHVGERLAAFKVPIEIEIQSAPIERNANGKIIKAPLRERFLKYSKDNQ